LDRPTNNLGEIRYLTDFRGVAILVIVLLHTVRTLVIRGAHPDDSDLRWLFVANDTLFRNATLYFTLISAIVYAQKLRLRPWPTFILQRFRNVVTPYAFVSLVLTLTFNIQSITDLSSVSRTFFYNLVWGEAFYHLWYIPVIMTLYVISPLLLAIAQNRNLTWISAILVIAPLIFPRQATEVTFFTFAYFLGAYFIGLHLGLDIDSALNTIGRYKFFFWIATFLSTLGIFYLLWTGHGRLGWFNASESLFYIQRLASAGLILLFLRRYTICIEKLFQNTIRIFAIFSFSIYFIHAPVIRALVAIRNRAFDYGVYFGINFEIMAIFTLTCAFCLAFAWVLRWLFGHRSSLLIGA
jgi:surface polysaccharide O-acyltransferase-like enzyme